MKNVSLILNVVLIVAVGVLYLFTFNSHAKIGDTDKPVGNIENMDLSQDKIVFVNFDTLVSNYDFYLDLQNEMMEATSQSEAQLANRTRQFETQAADFQNKVQKGLVTRAQAEEMQRQLMAQEQEVYGLRDQLTRELAEKEQVMLRQIQNSIEEYLIEFNKDYGYKFILSKTFGGQVLYTEPSLDVTSEVLVGINKKYQDNK